MLGFVWDPIKAAKNVAKHKVSFPEAQTVFQDEMAFVVSDPDHSENEERMIITGLSLVRRVLIVVYCERNDGHLIRIISSRKATKQESKFYFSRY